MLQIRISAGAKYIHKTEYQAIEDLRQHYLAAEDGVIIPIKFVGNQISNREIDALLLLPDAIFLLECKNWDADRIEVEGINGKVRFLRDGAWGERDNPLPNYEYAARELATQLKRERWLPVRPHIYSVMVFTSYGLRSSPQVSFAGGNPKIPQPKDGVCACSIEQLPQLIAAFRAAAPTRVELTPFQVSTLANVFLDAVKPAKPEPRRIEGYLVIAEHHTDTFLDCKIYMGEGEPIKEPVWIKEYEQVLASQDQRSKREQLVLRHADVLYRFPQHKNIVQYRTAKPTPSHLYTILSRQPGAFLSELLTGKPLGPTTEADLQRIPFDMPARLQILGGLLEALDYLTRQPGFEQSAYRDLRPDSIFVQCTDATPIAQLFNFDCTKIPGAITRRDYLREGLKRSAIWDDYASPELLDYIESGASTPGTPVNFPGDVRSDLFSWGVIAWELLTGELPFPTTEAKLEGRRNPWPTHLATQGQTERATLSDEARQLIEACLASAPTERPSLATLRRSFP